MKLSKSEWNVSVGYMEIFQDNSSILVLLVRIIQPNAHQEDSFRIMHMRGQGATFAEWHNVEIILAGEQLE